MNLLIVQPWFSAIGHPAQSLLNTAKVLGAGADVQYLIADPGDGGLSSAAHELEGIGPTRRFNSFGSSLRRGTVLSLPAILCAARMNTDLQDVFFLDADLVSLAATWPIVAIGARRVRSVSMVYLGGPERIASHALARKLVSRFLSSRGRRLFLRTMELMQAWRHAFPEVPEDRIDTIPSLEIVDELSSEFPPQEDGRARFGVIGQVRPGKSLEWLVPMFRDNERIGILHVAGEFTNPRHRELLSFLAGYANFDNRFLTEVDMLQVASGQDYLVALYDDWDSRMEAATVYLAARVGRPVIVYDEGWPGRMVREFGCGVAVARSRRPDQAFFSGLPRPGEKGYQALLSGIEKFRDAHKSSHLREVFLAKLLGHSGTS